MYVPTFAGFFISGGLALALDAPLIAAFTMLVAMIRGQVLWNRMCALLCPHCHKPYYRWWIGIQQLKKPCHRCGFDLWP